MKNTANISEQKLALIPLLPIFVKIEFFIVNLILSDVAFLCRLG